MKIGLAAYDAGPNNMFKLVAPVLTGQGHQVSLAPANERWTDGDVDDLLEAAVVATGFASFQPTQESYLIGRLHEWEIPHVLAEDVPGGLIGRVAENLPAAVSRAASLVVALPDSIAKAKASGFSDSQITVITPPHWGPAYQAMTKAGDARQGLMVATPTGFQYLEGGNAPLFVVWGTKELALEVAMLKHTIQAASIRYGREGFVIGHHAHPALLRQAGVTDPIALPGLNEVFRGVKRLVTQGLTITQALRAADVAVCSGGPLESIICAFARKPLIYYTGSYDGGTVVERNKRQGMSNGRWFVAELGGAVTADENNFSTVLDELLSVHGRSALQANQADKFPLPAEWDTAPILAQHLLDQA